MYNFEYLDKSKRQDILPLLFDMIYENLKDVAPSELTYDEEKAEFINEVAIALEKEPRRMILCYCAGELAGFLMYYTRENLLMVEEVQIIAKHQKTMAFYRLCRFLLLNLPENIEIIEAFADIRNVPSIRLQKSLGMRKTESHDLQLYHFVGDAKKIRKRFERG